MIAVGYARAARPCPNNHVQHVDENTASGMTRDVARQRYMDFDVFSFLF